MKNISRKKLSVQPTLEATLFKPCLVMSTFGQITLESRCCNSGTRNFTWFTSFVRAGTTKTHWSTFLNYFFIYIYLFIHLSLVDILFNHCCCTLVFLYSTKKKNKNNKKVDKKRTNRKQNEPKKQEWSRELACWDGERRWKSGMEELIHKLK